MRSLAFVVVVTLLVGCVPVQTRGQAYAGNLVLVTAASAAAFHAFNRECDYVSPEEDLFAGLVDTAVVDVPCEMGRQLELDVGEALLVTALVAIGRTLYEDDRRRAATTALRSR